MSSGPIVQFQDYGPLMRLVMNQFFVPVSVSNSGDTTLVSGTANYHIRVIKYSLACAGDVVVTWKSSSAGAITGPKSYPAKGGHEGTFSPAGIFQTAVGEDLVINLSGAVSVGGELTYVLA